MFWTTCGSWLKASSTRNELSEIFHSSGGRSAVCAAAGLASATDAASAAVAMAVRTCMRAEFYRDSGVRYRTMSGLRDALATEQGKADYTRRLFHTIAPRYDLITRLLSYGN